MEKKYSLSASKFEIYNVITEYLNNGTYPFGYTKDDKRKLRSRAKRFRTSSCGKLLYDNGRAREVTMDAKEAYKILFEYHDIRGHLGRDKTVHAIEEIYFWDGMYADIEEYIKSCEKCQLINVSKFDKTTCELHPIPIKAPWHHVGMDLISLPESKNGNKYIFTLCDYFSKWSEAVALPDKSAETVALALYKICLRMGFPNVYSSDQGREFVNKIMDVLTNITKSEQRISTAYHPQTNGLVERFNQTLQRMLLKSCQSIEKDDWDEYMEECVYSYRVSVQASTKVTPFEAMFGRKAVTVTAENEREICVADEAEYEATAETTLQDLQKHRDKIFETIKENVNLAQMKQKRQHAAKMKKGKNMFKEGDAVLLYNARKASRKGSKLEHTWTGPYFIAEELGKNVYRIKSEEGVVLKKKYNGSLLKVYNKRKEIFDRNSFTIQETEQFLSMKETNPEETPDIEISSFQTEVPLRYFSLPPPKELQEMVAKLNIDKQNDHYKYGDEAPTHTILGPPKNVIQVQGDGNCFFRSISHIVSGTETYHEQVRKSVVQYIANETNKETFQSYCDLPDIAEYRKKMTGNGIWATDVEVMATASLLNVDIEIFTKIGNETKWLRYPASFTHDVYTPFALYLENKHGVHFNVVTSV